MKKFFNFRNFGILCIVALFTGCAKQEDASTTVVSNNMSRNPVVLQLTEVEGHSYIVGYRWDSFRSGIAIIHAESCPCKQK